MVKPQVKDDEFFCKEVYADKLQNHFSLLCEKLDSPAVEDVEMLAEKVCRVFLDKEKQKDMSVIAASRHDPLNNNQQLLSIYNKIIGR